jgi:hypothetical protein
MSDHVHLLASIPPSLAVSRLVWAIKGASSHEMAHRIAPGRPFRWQEGYGAFTLRKEDCETVAQYILNQRAHHAAGTMNPDWERWEDERPNLFANPIQTLARGHRAGSAEGRRSRDSGARPRAGGQPL